MFIENGSLVHRIGCGLRQAFCLFLAICCSAFTHGLNTTFDPSQWPGATISTINCTGSDAAAFSSWTAAAIAGNPTQQVLHITGNCRINGDQQITSGITSWVIWAYGSTITRPYIGAANVLGNHHLINPASISQGSVTLQNSFDAQYFAVGNYALVNGLENQAQDCGSPPNPYFFDYVLVSAINATTGEIDFVTTPLTSNYLSTWPLQCVDAAFTGSISGTTLTVTAIPVDKTIKVGLPLNGPGISATTEITGFLSGTGQTGTYSVNNSQTVASEAMTTGGDGPAGIRPLGAAWNTNGQVYGMTINDTGQAIVTGRTMFITNTFFPDNGIAPTLSDTITVQNSNLRSSEMDKLINLLTLTNITSNFIHFQSASIKEARLTNVSAGFRLQGTPKKATLKNINTPEIWLGPDGYGAGETITVDGLNATVAVAGTQRIAISLLTYSSGTFSLALTDPSISTFIHMGVVGHKYAFGEALFSPFASPTTAFTITAVRQDATNYYWDTTLVGVLPTPTCGGSPCTQIVSYPASTITQTNTPNVNLTQYAAPP